MNSRLITVIVEIHFDNPLQNVSFFVKKNASETEEYTKAFEKAMRSLPVDNEK
jgi:hypothetical protein